MELNEFEYQMLDALLEAIGSSDQLSRSQVLELFGADEAFAADMVSQLVAEGLITESGTKKPGQLPQQVTRQAKARTFLENGGFSNPKETLAAPGKPAWDEEHLKKRNTELQNDTLRLQRTIREKDGELQTLKQTNANAAKYKIGLYAAVIVITILIAWIAWLIMHHHR